LESQALVDVTPTSALVGKTTDIVWRSVALAKNNL
jgi:hypothetical protein